MIAVFCFWGSIYFLAHTYVVYGVLLKRIAKGKKPNQQHYLKTDNLPTISILLAAYNEEEVIEQKIKSTFNTGYPLEKIELIIGSDASNDATDRIINTYQQHYPQLILKSFKGRTGKPKIINQLAQVANGELFVITDANVFFTPTTLFELVKHFKEESIGLVGGNILNHNLKKDGISHQEKTYLKGENEIKYQEGVVWGAMIGTFGGVFAMRSDLYEAVPAQFTVDDFYITMSVIEKGKKTILERDAIAYEDVSNQLSEEFRRKTRISMGNFQNLVRFSGLLNPFTGVGFAFLSHKVFRWLGPIFILTALISSFMLSDKQVIYQLAFWAEVSFLSIPFVDSLFRKLKLHFFGLRFITHFVWMNLALLNGLIKFIFGVKSNIWTPTQRNQ